MINIEDELRKIVERNGISEVRINFYNHPFPYLDEQLKIFEKFLVQKDEFEKAIIIRDELENRKYISAEVRKELSKKYATEFEQDLKENASKKNTLNKIPLAKFNQKEHIIIAFRMFIPHFGNSIAKTLTMKRTGKDISYKCSVYNIETEKETIIHLSENDIFENAYNIIDVSLNIPLPFPLSKNQDKMDFIVLFEKKGIKFGFELPPTTQKLKDK